MAWGMKTSAPKTTKNATTTVDPRTGQQVGYSPILYDTSTGYSPAGPTQSAYDASLDPAPVGGGGGGSGGVAPYDPTTDPTYQAYIANLDLNQAQQQADTSRRIAQLQGNQTQQLADSARAGQQSQTGISNSYEGRGLYNSGARLNDLSIQQANQGARENSIKTGTANSISDLETTLANAVAQMALRRQSAAQGVFS